MSFSVVPEQRSTNVPFRLRLLARLTVTVAWLLIRLSPGRQRRVLSVAARRARPATYEKTLDCRQAVVTVSRKCAGLGCLQRAVATALLCRMHGTWPEWCTGVRTEPFRAHAWVEAEGRPVGEGDDIRLFHKMLHIPATTTGSAATTECRRP
ncbi:lasso peptide biosynthesis B2 protein [Streptomyces sp. NBC_01795]|uniref:lasso peptide biosynthesis B2 protein n=1 Tax=unclassified Streptomyces TaxID=2593676 RepID=UPI002DDA9DAF|nr:MULTISPECIES: lasso peptide biosynthesis B2 protein [unclassified Streptomyces]WSA90726.1 lasso peptide biosynthesis B2 protein [Streptomyces sp. NBC_01795]WSB75050.1 lasso peptide biosynthesis B2 protein [Streptomyces sp. NBC_01775]WSS16670.1 lasso peptide biosynthesis B2 protein [Streptomyces sp. NBC_01186]